MQGDKSKKDGNWDGRFRGGYLGNLIFDCLIRYGGVYPAYVLLLFVAVYFIPAAPRATSSIWYYNRRILHYGFFKSMVMLYLHYFSFGQVLIDKVAIVQGRNKEYRFDTENRDAFMKSFQDFRESGCVFIGAHVGSWESGVRFFGQEGKKINVVMFNASSSRERHISGDHKILSLSEDPIENTLKIKAVLDAREYVCFQGDRFIEGQRTLKVPFMGEDAEFPLGPFLFSVRLKVPVVFYFSMRLPGKGYRFYLKLAEPVSDGSSEPAQRQLLDQYIKILEDIVRQYPQQWFNFYPFWGNQRA